MQGLRRFRPVIYVLFTGVVIPSLGLAEPASFPTLERLLAKPEAQVDFAQAKFAVDLLIDPKQQTAKTLRQIDAWMERIKARLPANASRREKLDVLISTLYTPGSWNNYQPFQYDLDDPLGKNHSTKLLATYLSTRKGNCISMPIFFIILGQKLGLPVTLATAPEHAMVKYLDESGQWLNVEATYGGFKYDSSYEREFSITAKATENDIYLRPLSRRESVTVMMSTLMEHYRSTKQHERQIAVANLALKVDNKDVVAMQHKGAANYLLLQERFVRPYPDANNIPQEKRAEFKRLSAENLLWYAKAEALGWVPTTSEQEAKYLDTIRKEKLKRQGKQK